jgi:hypothetical protein
MSINLINTDTYNHSVIPIGATELPKTAFCELNLMELGQKLA